MSILYSKIFPFYDHYSLFVKIQYEKSPEDGGQRLIFEFPLQSLAEERYFRFLLYSGQHSNAWVPARLTFVGSQVHNSEKKLINFVRAKASDSVTISAIAILINDLPQIVTRHTLILHSRPSIFALNYRAQYKKRSMSLQKFTKSILTKKKELENNIILLKISKYKNMQKMIIMCKLRVHLVIAENVSEQR